MLFTLALRNLWRNRRRTLLTLSAMVVSSALLILSLGIFSGMLQDMLASATEQYYGHMLVNREGYQEDRDLYLNLSSSRALDEVLAGEPGITAASPRLRSFGLLSHADKSYPAELLGVIPQQERQVTTFAEHIAAGTYLPENLENGAVLGAGLAKKLGVKPGDELVFLTQAADGSIGNDLLYVTGIFKTDSSGDKSLVLVGLPWLQQVMALPDKVHEYSIRLSDPRLATEERIRLDGRLPAGLEALDWGMMMPEMREAVASYDVSRFIVVIILYVATGLGILNTFYMSVMERTREFGIAMALGMPPGHIRLLIFLEAFLLGIFALVCGVGIGLLLTLSMQTQGIDLSSYVTPITYAGGTILPRLRTVLEIGNLLVPALLLLLVCLVAAMLPAHRAAKLQPIEAIRED
ncbi:MAG: ABC transporter permease [Desulfuromonas sp.]|nr:MAG: ABC transporter permease [Desulfuromonas sp.]